MDALLLARVDFLLKSDSAVAEFGMWINPRLHRNHLDLQVREVCLYVGVCIEKKSTVPLLDVLFKSDSAVAEFGMWVNPRLHRNHLDLQVRLICVYRNATSCMRTRCETIQGYKRTTSTGEVTHACAYAGVYISL
jgi:hypothetical protein